MQKAKKKLHKACLQKTQIIFPIVVLWSAVLSNGTPGHKVLIDISEGV